ncbi:cellulose binding domain-containing protein, partial [Glycomyces tenuis]|uniref:cellulose binding domain-containing protein n=1 Tax=Glycomyces tenuis TaxID=58116 RepID=UPI001B809522
WGSGWQGNVLITAGDSAVSGWTLNWTWPSGQSISSSWNADISERLLGDGQRRGLERQYRGRSDDERLGLRRLRR